MTECNNHVPGTIQGGRVDVNGIECFLAAWDWSQLDMPWRIWEWVSDIAFDYQTGAPIPAPGNFRRAAWLERVRIFGESGDLELRRDGAYFLWHFVGQANIVVPTGFENVDYWQAYPTRSLACYSRQVMLWGQEIRDAEDQPRGIWQEDRVGYAQLIYPQMKGDQRVLLHYNEYLYGDNVEAVWWLGLERWEGKNG